jgi:cytochrome P450 family 619
MVELYELMEEWSKVMETGATPPVDILPILKFVPERFFGNWITRSRNVGKAMDALYGRMVSRVMQRRMESGSKGSFLDGILDQQDKLNLSRNEINFLCGVMMEGGSDTSSSIILAFIHAMIKYPHVQKKAQQGIDSVMGEDRSPLWSDYQKLPYVAMIIKETMRWRPVTPLAFPHASSEGEPASTILLFHC